jgi:hypothetical protein
MNLHLSNLYSPKMKSLKTVTGQYMQKTLPKAASSLSGEGREL